MSTEPEKILVRHFGQRVKSLRQMKAISQEELASLTGVHRTYIGMIERGEKNVTVLTICKLAAALEVDPAELVQGLGYGK